MKDDPQPVIDEVRAMLEERQGPDLTSAVMRGIDGLSPAPAPPVAPGPSVAGRIWRWLWAPRTLVIRPAMALVGAAALVVLFAVPYPGRRDSSSDPVAESRPPVFVQFRLETMATRVQLAGSFTNWEPRYELREGVPGVWSITVPLTQGVHDYAFIVDGQRWVADPHAPQVGDGFGGVNNRLALLTPDVPQL